MSQNGIFETLIATLSGLQAAIEANTAAIQGGSADTSSKATETKTTAGSKTSSAKGASSKAKKEEPAKPVHSKSETSAAVVAVKEKLGAAAAKELLSSFGIDKLANITEDKFDDVHAAALALVNESGEDENEEDDDI